MTKDQIRDERNRLQSLLDVYESNADADSMPDRHAGLRQPIAGLALRLAESNTA